MNRANTVAVVPLVLAALLLGRPAAAQSAPPTLRFHLGPFAPSAPLIVLGRSDSVPSRPALRAAPLRECRMPVVVPDLMKSERMPVARIDPAPYATRQVPVGCVNPLGPQPAATAGRRHPLQP